eukprot:TRINITY_DN1512_c0_g1_i1.p1 TRINITY_DN1512_c0_g1~~TRINITY_DN1512_c0_g1_i1.p1  ORF type:complete len:130 (-),score=28.54 TRINITY_DN1512_c0_g1_i1:1-390(-)
MDSLPSGALDILNAARFHLAMEVCKTEAAKMTDCLDTLPEEQRTSNRASEKCGEQLASFYQCVELNQLRIDATIQQHAVANCKKEVATLGQCVKDNERIYAANSEKHPCHLQELAAMCCGAKAMHLPAS